MRKLLVLALLGAIVACPDPHQRTYVSSDGPLVAEGWTGGDPHQFDGYHGKCVASYEDNATDLTGGTQGPGVALYYLNAYMFAYIYDSGDNLVETISCPLTDRAGNTAALTVYNESTAYGDILYFLTPQHGTGVSYSYNCVSTGSGPVIPGPVDQMRIIDQDVYRDATGTFNMLTSAAPPLATSAQNAQIHNGVDQHSCDLEFEPLGWTSGTAIIHIGQGCTLDDQLGAGSCQGYLGVPVGMGATTSTVF